MFKEPSSRFSTLKVNTWTVFCHIIKYSCGPLIHCLHLMSNCMHIQGHLYIVSIDHVPVLYDNRYLYFTANKLYTSFIDEHNHFVRYIHTSARSLFPSVLHDLFIKPALSEILALLNQLEQLKILPRKNLTCHDIFWKSHLSQQFTPAVGWPET